jgi:hypothetical protein
MAGAARSGGCEAVLVGIQGRTRGGSSFNMKLKYGAYGPVDVLLEKIKEAKDIGADMAVSYCLTTDLVDRWEKYNRKCSSL